MSSLAAFDADVVAIGIHGFSRPCRLTFLALVASSDFRVSSVIEEFMDLDYMAFQLRLDIKSFGLDLDAKPQRQDGLEFLMVGGFRVDVFHEKDSFDVAFLRDDTTYVLCDSVGNIPETHRQKAQSITISPGAIEIYMVQVAQLIPLELKDHHTSKWQHLCEELSSRCMPDPYRTSKKSVPEKEIPIGSQCMPDPYRLPENAESYNTMSLKCQRQPRKTFFSAGFRPKCVCCRLQMLNDERSEDQ